VQGVVEVFAQTSSEGGVRGVEAEAKRERSRSDAKQKRCEAEAKHSIEAEAEAKQKRSRSEARERSEAGGGEGEGEGCVLVVGWREGEWGTDLAQYRDTVELEELTGDFGE
jgi:hypothetical protein